MVTEKIKKEFQKVVAHIRFGYNATNNLRNEYPKAMLTATQAKKNTATINCSHSSHLAQAVLAHPALQSFIKAHGATAAVEAVAAGEFPQYQVRIDFPHTGG